MQLLDEYIAELSQDISIDEFSMKDVQMKLPAIKHKWTGRLMRAKIAVNDKYIEKAVLVEKLAEQLVQESPVTLTVVIVKKKVEEHSEVRRIVKQIKELKLIIEFLEKTEKTLSSITFDIRNLFEIIKLETQ